MHPPLPRPLKRCCGGSNILGKLEVIFARSATFIFPALKLARFGCIVAFAHSVPKILFLGDENYAVALQRLLQPSSLIEGETSHPLFIVSDLLSGQASLFGDDQSIDSSEGAPGAGKPGGQILRKYTHDLILSRCDTKHYVPVIIHPKCNVGAPLFGSLRALSARGKWEIGIAAYRWAARILPAASIFTLRPRMWLA